MSLKNLNKMIILSLNVLKNKKFIITKIYLNIIKRIKLFQHISYSNKANKAFYNIDQINSICNAKNHSKVITFLCILPGTE